MITMKPKDCPKWSTCSVALCPLESNCEKLPHLDDDSFCSMLLESGKDDAEAVFRGRGREDIYFLVCDVTPEILSRHARIKRAFKRASKTGSRMGRMTPRTKGDINH